MQKTRLCRGVEEAQREHGREGMNSSSSEVGGGFGSKSLDSRNIVTRLLRYLIIGSLKGGGDGEERRKGRGLRVLGKVFRAVRSRGEGALGDSRCFLASYEFVSWKRWVSNDTKSSSVR